jgi:hypothetical protein
MATDGDAEAYASLAMVPGRLARPDSEDSSGGDGKKARKSSPRTGVRID